MCRARLPDWIAGARPAYPGATRGTRPEPERPEPGSLAPKKAAVENTAMENTAMENTAMEYGVHGEDGMDVGGRHPMSLEVLRQEARDELAALIELRCRLGDDPWEFLPDLPTVDEQVVLTLRQEAIEAHELSEARARAYHPSAAPRERERFEYQLLRRVALARPELTPAVWSMLGRLDAA
jgi:hypothetical protein